MADQSTLRSTSAEQPLMYRFFINRPIVAMVIAILMVLIGAVSMVSLPIPMII